MNPQVVWNVWRRILREPMLQNVIFNEKSPNLESFGFTGEAREAALAYAREADRARWFVLNYRYRLANSFLNALETGAPLVLRSLLAKGVDLRVIGEEFLNRCDWRDYGPYVYAYCRDALDFLAASETTQLPSGLRQLIELEKTVVELLMSLSEPLQPAMSLNKMRRTPVARHFRSEMRVSAWLRDKKQLGRTDLAAGVEHYLVYLPNLDSSHKFALLPLRAAEIYQALAQPCAREHLPTALEMIGCEPHDPQDDDLLNLLAKYGAIEIPGEV